MSRNHLGVFWEKYRLFPRYRITIHEFSFATARTFRVLVSNTCAQLGYAVGPMFWNKSSVHHSMFLNVSAAIGSVYLIHFKFAFFTAIII